MELPVSIGEIVANKYRIDRVIGAGGMGVVFAAFHCELEQPVAIKFLKGEAGSRADAAERFRREARAAARIHSEHVVRVLDIAVSNHGIPYMVMELLDGNDLERELELTGPLPIPIAVEYVLQAIDAVAGAHASGVVHRDLKPTNLFLARRSDGSRTIKVLDFGISKVMGPGWGPEAALTRSASIFGSPLYMSPEQMRSSKDVDARADIWSLGAILYELLAGRPPYVAESMPALCVAIMTDPPNPLVQLAPATPPELELVVRRCLAHEPLERYQTAAELASALAPFTPNGQTHAERARRLLRQSLVNPSATTALQHRAPFTPLPRDATPSPGPAFSSSPGPTPAVQAPTQASWGKTGGRAMTNRKSYVVFGAAALVLLVAAGVLLRRALEPDAAYIHSARSASASQPSVAAVSSTPAETTALEPARDEVAVGALDALATPESAAPSTSGRAEAPPSSRSSEAPPTGKPAKAQRPPESPARSEPSRPKPNKDSALTDFGGRLY